MRRCPDCTEEIIGIAAHPRHELHALENYVIGWCQRDVHTRCLFLHIRSCQACRAHNEAVIAYQDQQRHRGAA